MVPVVRAAWQTHAHLHPSFGGTVGGCHLLAHGQPLHAAVGGDPLATGYIAIADIGFKRQSESFGLL